MDNVYFAEKIQEHKAKVKKNKWAMWSWIVVGILLVGYVVFMQISSVGDRKLLAKLKHEKDVHEEDQRQAVVQVKVEKIEERKAVLRQEIVARHARSAKLEEEIELREVKKEELHERISKITDWDDIDRNIVFRPQSGNK